jgi:hypothetical protein
MQRHPYDWAVLAENRWPRDGRRLTVFSDARGQFPALDVTMVPQRAATPRRGRTSSRIPENGRERSLSGAMARQGGQPTSWSMYRRILYDTEARGSRRDIVRPSVERRKNQSNIE